LPESVFDDLLGKAWSSNDSHGLRVDAINAGIVKRFEVPGVAHTDPANPCDQLQRKSGVERSYSLNCGVSRLFRPVRTSIG